MESYGTSIDASISSSAPSGAAREIPISPTPSGGTPRATGTERGDESSFDGSPRKYARLIQASSARSAFPPALVRERKPPVFLESALGAGGLKGRRSRVTDGAGRGRVRCGPRPPPSFRIHSRNACTSGRCREAAVLMRQPRSDASAGGRSKTGTSVPSSDTARPVPESKTPPATRKAPGSPRPPR